MVSQVQSKHWCDSVNNYLCQQGDDWTTVAGAPTPFLLLLFNIFFLLIFTNFIFNSIFKYLFTLYCIVAAMFVLKYQA